MTIPFTTAAGTSDLLGLTPEDLSAERIADALSKINRFSGRTPEPWSVASHSLLVSTLAPIGGCAWGLLHDAHEAFLGDITEPGNRLVAYYSLDGTTAIQLAKSHLDDDIAGAWSITDRFAAIVRHWDRIACEAEMFMFFGRRPQVADEHVEDIERALALIPELPMGSDWKAAREGWLERARWLDRHGMLQMPRFPETEAA